MGSQIANRFVKAKRLHGGRPRKWLPKGNGWFFLFFIDTPLLLTFRQRKGIHVSALFRSGERFPVPTEALQQWEYPSMAIKKRSAAVQAGKHLASVESSLLASLLPLVEHCSHREYDDGSPREVGWFTVKTTGAAWVVQVKDPDGCCSFSAVADTIDKALQTAALLLACDEAPWEPDSWLHAAKMKKKK